MHDAPIVMQRPRFYSLIWLGAGVASVLGAGLLAQAELQREHDAFDTNARIVHRLLSQRVVPHDAVLATLSLLQPGNDPENAAQRLPAVFLQVRQAERRSAGQAWPRESLTQAEASSREQQRPALGQVDLALGRYELVTAAGSGAYALLIDLRQLVPWDEWPMSPASSPVQVQLVIDSAPYVVQPSRADIPQPGWTFRFNKLLASNNQAFDVQAQLTLGWTALVLAAAWGSQAWRRQRTERRRAEELLRLGQVARLNTLGELAAGIAHELNQPLTAVLANTQAAQRLLTEEPHEPTDLQLAR
jgi:signal transduction histidine kinase